MWSFGFWKHQPFHYLLNTLGIGNRLIVRKIVVRAEDLAAIIQSQPKKKKQILIRARGPVAKVVFHQNSTDLLPFGDSSFDIIRSAWDHKNYYQPNRDYLDTSPVTIL